MSDARVRLEKGEVEIRSRIQMLNSTHTLVSPTPTALEGYLLEFESSMSVSFVSEYSRKCRSTKCRAPLKRIKPIPCTHPQR